MQKLRQHDKSLMEIAIQAGHPRSELECLNACRWFLQVTTLAEITNDCGNSLLPQAYGLLQPNQKPQLWLLSRSSLKWPAQPLPSVKAWRLLKKFLKSQLNARQKLLQPLGPWYTNYNAHRQWNLLSDGLNLIKTTTKENTLYRRTENRSRHHLKFSVVRPTTKTFDTPCLPITPIIDDGISITCKPEEFHLLEPIHDKHSSTYKIYHIPRRELTSEPIEFTYTTEYDEKHLEIIGVVLQNDIPKKILRLYNKYYFERPKQLSRQECGCLLFASFLSNHHLTHPTTLHIATKTSKTN
jgi:hypothetical protein